MKLTSLFALIGWRFHGAALSGRGFGHTEKLAHSACPDSPKRYYTKILPRTVSRTGESANTHLFSPCVSSKQDEGASRQRVPWVVVDGI